MTTETQDYETLTDRELDALVAERVMGFHPCTRGEQYGWDGDRHYNHDEFRALHYSTDPGAAFTVLEAMRAQGYFVGVSGSEERWNASIHHKHPGATVWHDKSMPRAVCVAALRALDAEGNQ